MSARLEFALDLVHRAGRGTLGRFQTRTEMELKPDNSPVTIADREAESLIRREIDARFPNESVLGEEEGLGEGDAARRWIVDPIDGTKSFVSGVPLYATLLAFEEEGVPVLGVCYFPALDEMIWAERGEGAFWNGRRAQVSSRDSVGGSVLCCGGHRLMQQMGRMEPLLELSERAMATRTWSDAYGHALVATGRVEAMIDPSVSRWDVSAMKVIVEEAGGRMTDFRGADALKTQTHGHLEALSSNGLIHPELLEVFRA